MANNAEKHKVFIQGVQKSISSSYSHLGDFRLSVHFVRNVTYECME